jgi:glycosyltransferase involved in cell wall biosynthesis
MKNVLKVIHTPVRFYPEIGGVENHVLYLAKELVKKDISVEVICAGNTDLKPEAHGIKISRLHSLFKITNTDITLTLPFILFKSDFDIIHTHMPTPWTADWSVLIARLKRKKSIITIHNDMQKSGFLAKLLTDFYLHTVFLLTLHLVNKIILVNPDWKDSFPYTKQLLERFEKKIVVIPNGVDTDLFKPQTKKEKSTILFVSVLDKYHLFKGFDYLLKAMPAIRKSVPRVKLQVIGEGELKKIYQETVRTMGFTKQISFLGAKSQNELPYYFGKASTFVLPSIHTEGYGIVLLEALSTKTPVVTTEITGLSTDIRKYKAGKVIKPGNEKELSNALIKTLTSTADRKKAGERGRKLVELKYSWVKIATDMKELYEEVLL